MKIASIVDNDAVNSLTGFTLSIFFQGCEHACKNCIQAQTWDWNNGKDIEYKHIQETILNTHCKNVSIIGGDVFYPKNRKIGLELIKWIKENTDKTLYVWTGYSKEQVEEWIDISIIDFLITDKFEVDKLNLKILLRGSTNQRIFCKGIQKTDEQIIEEYNL